MDTIDNPKAPSVVAVRAAGKILRADNEKETAAIIDAEFAPFLEALRECLAFMEAYVLTGSPNMTPVLARHVKRVHAIIGKAAAIHP